MKNISLVFRFSIISLIAIAVFGYAFGILLGRAMEQSMFNKSTEETADIVVQNVVKHFKEKDLVRPKTGRKHNKFSHKMDHLSLGKDIVNAKIWNNDFQLVWDKDKDSVGKEVEKPDELQALNKAFSGKIVTEASNFRDLEEKHQYATQGKRVLEMFIPIQFEPQGKVANVFEVYHDLNPLYKSITHHKKMVWMWTILGFSSLYVILFGGYWDASRRLKKQTREIVQSKLDWEDTFNTITDMITIHDREFNILRANKAAEQNFGLSSLNEMNANCHKIFHGSDNPPDWCPGARCLKTGKPDTFDIFDARLNKHFDIRAIPRFDGNNQIIGFIHDVRDISDIKKAEEDKTKLQNQLLQTQKMDSIGRLAGGVAHDFNNLLSVIIGFSEMSLKDLPADSHLRDNLTTIHDTGEKAASLTRQLLAFSRKQVLEMKAIDINTIFENMLKMLERLVPANVNFEFNPQESIQSVLADPTQLEQILMNLVVNARDAMPDGGQLTITTKDFSFKEKRLIGNEETDIGPYVMLSVTDTGTGMPKKVMERIFEPFYTTKDLGKGTGMGLSTVYGIVKQHKGYIAVNSDPGKGTSFEIYFPATEVQTDEIAQETTHENIRGNETILVVDDEPLLLKVISNMLKPLGYCLLTASSAEEALKLSDDYKGTINLILTDVVMPGMNGNQLVDTLTLKRPDIKVIFMSGYTDDAIEDHGVFNQDLLLISKPVTEKILTQKIRDTLDIHCQKEQIQTKSHNIHGTHILLVDDNKDIQLLIQSFLKQYDCRIETADNGQIAVEKFKSVTYDLVLMDMQMPVMDGLQAVNEMRKWEKENGKEQKTIIALTGNSSEYDIDNCLKAGFTSHVAKPIKREQLIDTLLSHSSETQNICNHGSHDHNKKLVTHVDMEFKELIPGYIAERQSDIHKIREALKIQDYETIRTLGHTLKGSGGGFGFDTISEIGSNIEHAAQGKNSGQIQDNVNQLAEYIDNVEIVYE
jgi:PAS domain S-box-containing protein